MALVRLQIGKKGLTPEFIENLRKVFATKTNESVRVGLLKSSTRNREEMKRWADEIISALGPNFTCKTIGYTMVIRKWRKAREAL